MVGSAPKPLPPCPCQLWLTEAASAHYTPRPAPFPALKYECWQLTMLASVQGDLNSHTRSPPAQISFKAGEEGFSLPASLLPTSSPHPLPFFGAMRAVAEWKRVAPFRLLACKCCCALPSPRTGRGRKAPCKQRKGKEKKGGWGEAGRQADGQAIAPFVK